MQKYDDLVQLARICLRQSKEAKQDGVATELRRMANDYRRRAANLDGGKLPSIEEA